jgi:hypothetical protein
MLPTGAGSSSKMPVLTTLKLQRAALPRNSRWFIDNTDTDVINVFLRLQEVKEKAAGNPKPGRKTPV